MRSVSSTSILRLPQPLLPAPVRMEGLAVLTPEAHHLLETGIIREPAGLSVPPVFLVVTLFGDLGLQARDGFFQRCQPKFEFLECHVRTLPSGPHQRVEMEC